MNLTTDQLDILCRCIGGGPLDRASLVIFGNELGTAEAPTLELTINKFVNSWSNGEKLIMGKGFSSLNISTPPISSTFLQFISRFALALRHKDERFFDTLSLQGKAFLNNYIVNELYKKDTGIINLRPLPQSTERHWGYSNIKEKEYYNYYSFSKRRPSGDIYSELRIQCLVDAFSLLKNTLVLGSGDKNNKKAFFEKYFNINFDTIKLDTTDIFVSNSKHIILSNYFDNRNGIKLIGLKEIYRYLVKEHII